MGGRERRKRRRGGIGGGGGRKEMGRREARREEEDLGVGMGVRWAQMSTQGVLMTVCMDSVLECELTALL